MGQSALMKAALNVMRMMGFGWGWHPVAFKRTAELRGMRPNISDLGTAAATPDIRPHQRRHRIDFQRARVLLHQAGGAQDRDGVGGHA
jgi:hypothetical protein